MTTFTRDAAEMLRAAESALSGRDQPFSRRAALSAHGPHATNYANTTYNKENRMGPASGYEQPVADGGALVSEDDARLLEVLRQLQVALAEIASLRSELSVERDARSASLTALRQRWKAELMAELRSGDSQLRRDVAELQYQVGEKLKEHATQNALLRRQIEELQRGAKVRDSTQFDRLELVQEELDGLRTKCDAAMAQSAATRVECAEQLERERAALGHRLDAELVRFADMRRDGHKELRIAKECIGEEVRKIGATVRDMVDDAWRSCAAALESSAKESGEAVKADVKHVKEAVRAMEERVQQCVQTCQGEARMLGVTLKERIAALESSEAVTSSRMQRAEKKSDAAHETTSRMDAAFLAVKESNDRATAVARQAAAQAQRVEDVLLDRDARLGHVESQLQAAASSEKLKAEIEACKRGVARVESQVDTLGRVSERCEALVEKAVKSNEAAGDRVARCEKLVEKSRDSVKEFVEAQQQWAQRIVAVEDLRDRVLAASEQQELTAARLEQRIAGCESKTNLLSERQSLMGKDVQHQQLALVTQLEGTRESASRSEAISATAKAEVERLEKRLAHLDSASATVTADCATARATVEEVAKDVGLLRRQMQQARELQEVRSSRVDEKLATFDKMESTVAEKMARVERHVSNQLEAINQRAANTEEQLEASLQDSLSRLQSRVEQDMGRHVDEIKQRVREVRAEARTAKHTEALEAAVADLQRAMHETHDQLGALAGLQNAVAKLESRSRRSDSEVAQQLHSMREDCEAVAHQLRQRCEGEVAQLQRRLQTIEAGAASSEANGKEQIRSLAEQHEQLHARVSALADSIASSLAVEGRRENAGGWVGGVGVSSAVSGDSTHPQGTTVLAPSKASTLEGSGGVGPGRAHSRNASLPSTHSLVGQQQQQQQQDTQTPSTTASPPPQREEVVEEDGGSGGGGGVRESAGEGGTHISSISPVRATSPAATAATSPGSSLAHALDAPGARRATASGGTPSATARGRLFDSTQPTPTPTSSSRSRSQEEENGSQPSSTAAAAAGLPPPVPTKAASPPQQQQQEQQQEPKRLPPPTALPASADTTLLGGGSTVGQRTMISRFIPLEDEPTTTTTSTQSEAVTPVPSRQRRAVDAGDERTDDISTSLTTSPSQTPSAKHAGGNNSSSRRPPAPSQAWGQPPSRSHSPSTDNDNTTTATRTVEKQEQPADGPKDDPNLLLLGGDVASAAAAAAATSVGGGVVSSSERADPPQVSTNRFDDWDNDEDEEDDEDGGTEGDPAMDLPMGDNDDDAVLPMHADIATPQRQAHGDAAGGDSGSADDDSPEPTGPQAAAAALRATPRKDFLGGAGDASDDDSLDREEVPHHGRATTSSSTTTGGSSASAARASAPGISPQQQQQPGGRGSNAPASRKYGSFDDSSSEDEL